MSIRACLLALASVVAAVLAPTAAFAWGEEFAGWSSDRSWYLIEASGMDGVAWGILCPVDEKGRQPKTWPPSIPFPKDPNDGGCSLTCEMGVGLDQDSDKCKSRLEDAMKRVRKPSPSKPSKTPHGERIVLAKAFAQKAEDSSAAVVTVLRGSAVAGRGRVDVLARGAIQINATYWRADGRQVAVEVSGASDGDEGAGPRVSTAVIDVAAPGAAAPASARALVEVDLLDAGAVPSRLEALVAVLNKAGFSVGHRGVAKTQRKTTDVYFAAGFEAEAREIAALASAPATAVHPLDWQSPYPITVAAGRE